MKNFYKIFLFGVIFTISILLSNTFASSVNAGDDQISDGDSTIYLSGSYAGFTGCSVDITWFNSDLSIGNNTSLESAYIDYNDIMVATGGNYTIQILLKTDYFGCVDPSDSSATIQDTMNLCIPNDGFSCVEEEEPPVPSSGGGSSRSSRMRSEARSLFVSTGAIDDINIILSKYTVAPKVLFKLNRNYIGGDGAIKYEIEYSNSIDFMSTINLDQYLNQTTKRRSYSIYVHDLNNESLTHYFRVRAVYKEKYSTRSNIIEYINEDSPLSDFVVECQDCDQNQSNKMDFMDMFFEPEFLLDFGFNTSCALLGDGQCTQNKTQYRDALDYVSLDTQVLVESNFETSCEEVGGRGCTQNKVNYNDVLSSDEGGLTKEICDGLDNNYNGIIDELDEIQKYYIDADFDGYGDPDREVTSICQKRYAVTNNFDCNDSNANIYPGADELCDGLDNDCDRNIDEDPMNAPIWYADVDQDSYGNSEQLILACSAPLGYVSDNTDCDDFNPLVFPTAVGQGCPTTSNPNR